MEVRGFMTNVRELFFERSDKIVDSWPISSNPLLIFGTLGTYWMFVYKIGPIWMRDRKPYDLKEVIMTYNVIQVLACLALVIWPFTDPEIMKSVFSLGCGNNLLRNSDKYRGINAYAWWYLIIKMVDLLDTVFFVLRRKQSQITFLHVYHHISVVVLALLYTRYTFAENVPILVYLNSLVHVFMYSYYFLAGLGSEMQKKLWWKRYITVIQLAQFLAVFLLQTITLTNSCKANNVTAGVSILYVSYFLYLFGKFYKVTYSKKRDKKVAIKS